MGRITNQTFRERGRLIHGDKYDYSAVNYIGLEIPVKIFCISCNEFFMQKPFNHIYKGGCGCQKCGKKIADTYHNNKSAIEFAKKASMIHGTKYDYSKCIYVSSKIGIKIYCNSCEQFFFQRPNDHLCGKGCKTCNNNALSFEEFKTKAITVHGNKYSYQESDYVIGVKHKMKILCNLCNFSFVQVAKTHLAGSGCPFCAGAGSKENFASVFFERVKNVHGNKYDYSNSEYAGAGSKIKIWCNSCNLFFWQRSCSHLSGRGCRNCALKNDVSNREIMWLDSLQISQDNRQIPILEANCRVDALVGNTVYEFYGDYWHGNPNIYKDPNQLNKNAQKTFGTLFDRTIKRHNKLISLGYNVKFVWESDWVNGLTFSENSTLIREAA